MSGTQEAGGQVEAIRNQVDDDVLQNAASEDVDVDGIIERQAQKYSDYSPDTVARFTTTAIESEIEAEKADTVKGILLGSRDVHDRNHPLRYYLVQSDGDHKEVNSWESTAPTADGGEVEIPRTGSITELDVNYDEEYDSYDISRISRTKQLGLPELAENLNKVAVGPGDISRGDKYDVYVIKGTVTWVGGQTKWEDGEQAGDGDVLMEDERGRMQPHMEISLNAPDGTLFRGHLGRQSKGQPFISVTDLERACQDAVSEFSTPERQARFVGDVLKGVEVILVGSVSSVDQSRDEESGDVMTFVDMNVGAMIEAHPDPDEGDEDLGSFDEEPVEGAEEVVDDDDTEGSEDAEDESADSEEESGSGESEEEEHECECGATFGSQNALNGHRGSCDGVGEDDEEPEPEPGRVDEVSEKIEQYRDLTGEDLETVGAVKDHIKGADEWDDIVVRHALNGGSDASASGGEMGPLEEAMQPLLEGGTYNCPVDGCLASFGNTAQAIGHGNEEHDLDTVDAAEAAEWVGEKLEA